LIVLPEDVGVADAHRAGLDQHLVRSRRVQLHVPDLERRTFVRHDRCSR